MNGKTRRIYLCLNCLLLIMCIGLFLGAIGGESKARRIVVFQDWFSSEAAQDNILKKAGAFKHKSLKMINGTAVDITASMEKELKENQAVLRIDEDLTLCAFQTFAVNKKKDKNVQPEQVITWNMIQVGADLAWNNTTGKSVKVAICDTGIDLDHPDLIDNIVADVNLIKQKKTGDDDSGHGTHVAGIVAAADNDIGVVGVGPEIELYAVKILDHKGRGWLSDLIEAFDWCLVHDVQVINMSFGRSNDNLSFREAVQRVYEQGIVLVAAAGNNGDLGGDISFPARYPETIAVSAVDRYGAFDPLSSYGEEIDLTAPGVDIRSTYEDGSYAIMSGTSMSAPHVTGAAALLLTTSPSGAFDLNKNNEWDPYEVKIKLMETAFDLGLPPDQGGEGLVWIVDAIR